MGLKWILNSAFTQVLGLTEKLQQNQKEAGGEGIKNVEQVKEGRDCFYGGGLNFESGFQMPLHYPRYTKRDYEEMEEGIDYQDAAIPAISLAMAQVGAAAVVALIAKDMAAAAVGWGKICQTNEIVHYSYDKGLSMKNDW